MEIGIIGSGNVGITSAFAIAEKGSGHITLFDRTDGKAQGKALDLAEAGPIRRYDRRIKGTSELEDLLESDILILAAGKARTSGMQRFDLLDDNNCFVQSVAETFKEKRKNPSPPIVIVLTEPVDVMTLAFQQASEWPRERIMGVGGLLSSSRLRHFVSRELGLSPADVTSLVVGTHNEKMVILERYSRISGLPLDLFLSRAQIKGIFERTVGAGTEIVEHAKVGSSFYTPGAAVGALVHAIVSDSNQVLPVSVVLDGEYGAREIACSVPAKVGKAGVKGIFELELTEQERAALDESIATQKPLIKHIGECHA